MDNSRCEPLKEPHYIINVNGRLLRIVEEKKRPEFLASAPWKRTSFRVTHTACTELRSSRNFSVDERTQGRIRPVEKQRDSSGVGYFRDRAFQNSTRQPRSFQRSLPKKLPIKYFVATLRTIWMKLKLTLRRRVFYNAREVEPIYSEHRCNDRKATKAESWSPIELASHHFVGTILQLPRLFFSFVDSRICMNEIPPCRALETGRFKVFVVGRASSRRATKTEIHFRRRDREGIERIRTV